MPATAGWRGCDIVSEAAPRSSPPGSDEVSLLGLLNSLLRSRRPIAALSGALVLLVALWTLLAPRTYSAWTSFMPQVPQGQPSGLAGFAAQLGFGGAAGAPGQSPRFYARLLLTRELLAATADSTYSSGQGAGARVVSLAELLDVASEVPPVRREVTIRRLRGLITVLTDAETGLVTARVTTRWPGLSVQIAQRLLAHLDHFNAQTRQSAARSERLFAENRLAEAQGELRASEERLRAFLERNRNFDNSPQLVFEQARLQRDVAVRQAVVSSLVQSFEQARIAEVRDTPVITVVESPALPVLPDPRRLPVKVLLALLGGIVLGSLLALARDATMRRQRSEGDDMTEFQLLWDATVRDLVLLPNGVVRRVRRAAERR